MAAHLPALPSPARLLRQHRASNIAFASQQTPTAPVKRAVAWGTREARPGVPAPPAMQEERSCATATTPMDVVVEDLRFLQARTGLDLLTPLQEVREVHDQVRSPFLFRHIQRCNLELPLQKSNPVNPPFCCLGIWGALSAGKVRARAQVVAVLNPIAGEKMQEELETRISSLQQELDKAHSQVHFPAAAARHAMLPKHTGSLC